MDIFHDFCHQALDTMFQNFFTKNWYTETSCVYLFINYWIHIFEWKLMFHQTRKSEAVKEQLKGQWEYFWTPSAFPHKDQSGIHSSKKLKKDEDCRIAKLLILQRDYPRAKPECNLEGNWLVLHKIIFSSPILLAYRFSSTFQNSFTVPHHGWGLKSFKNTAK